MNIANYVNLYKCIWELPLNIQFEAEIKNINKLESKNVYLMLVCLLRKAVMISPKDFKNERVV